MIRSKPYVVLGFLWFLSPPTFSTSSSSYEIGVEHIMSSVMTSSKEIESFKKLLLADDDLVASEKKYFYPKVNLTSTYNDYYGDISPPTDKDFDVRVELLMTLYSDTTSDKISAAENNRLSSGYNLKQKVNEIYFSIVGSLISIERSRIFLQDAKLIEIQLKNYIARVSESVNQGISPQSYLRETELVKVRFDNIITTVESNIDRYFKDLSLATGYKIKDSAKVGVNPDFLQAVIQNKIEFDPSLPARNNFGLLAKYHQVQGLHDSADAQLEKMKLTFFNNTDSGLISTETNINRGLRNTSVMGLRFQYQLFDYQQIKNQSSSYNSYYSELALLDYEKENIYLQALQLKDNYFTLVKKRSNLLEQVKLSKELVAAQEREILLGRIDFIDIVKSLPELIRTDVTLLDNDLDLYNTITDYKRLVSIRFDYEGL